MSKPFSLEPFLATIGPLAGYAAAHEKRAGKPANTSAKRYAEEPARKPAKERKRTLASAKSRVLTPGQSSGDGGPSSSTDVDDTPDSSKSTSTSPCIVSLRTLTCGVDAVTMHDLLQGMNLLASRVEASEHRVSVLETEVARLEAEILRCETGS